MISNYILFSFFFLLPGLQKRVEEFGKEMKTSFLMNIICKTKKSSKKKIRDLKKYFVP